MPIYKDYKLLKSFQLEGLNWLIRSWHCNRNCILADEMGLGKTIQAIAFLNHLHTFEGVIGPFLVVAPVSTLKQWRAEIEAWSELNCVLYKGKREARGLIE
jgi:chromodomain-helicase-DNA-binding protein 7